jgi:hypothetical protein
VQWILFIYFVLSGVTWVAGETGQGVLGRLALPDLFMMGVAFILIAAPGIHVRLSRLGLAGVVMLLAFAPGVLLAPDLGASLLEYAVYAYALFGFLVVYSLVARLPVEGRLETMVWWCRAGAVLAVVGLYDLMAVTLGLPTVASLAGQSLPSTGGFVGTFRNTGQAGAFLVTVLAVALPLSTAIDNPRRKNELTVIVAVLVLALVLSVKRAALLALLVGGILFLLRGVRRRELGRTVAVGAVSVMLLVPAYRWLSAASEAFRWRITHKLSSGAGETVSRFAESNILVAREAFTAEPLFGVGLGTISADGTVYELHSTYLNVLASAGIVGFLAYAFLIFSLFQGVSHPRNGDPRVKRFARMFVPMLLGLMLSYGYTNHLRKREFWITAALATALMGPEAGRRARRAAEDEHPWEEPAPREPALAAEGVAG